MLINFLNEDQRFNDIKISHTFPAAYSNVLVSKSNKLNFFKISIIILRKTMSYLIKFLIIRLIHLILLLIYRKIWLIIKYFSNLF